MKKILFATLFILICSNVMAQMPMGGGRGGRPQGGPPGNRPSMSGEKQNQDFVLMGMPEIPNLTLEQREKLSKAISEERKDISKLMDKKQELRQEASNPGIAEKKRTKLQEKIDKVDNDIKKKETKYDKKYRSILSLEQYEIFIENKKNIEFRGQGNRLQRGNRPQRPGQGGPPDMPNDNMFDNDRF